jgi:hypothetical protein
MTIIPLPAQCCRIAFNRDEQRSRPTALFPRIQRFGDGQAILPIDPLSGGTWIGVNDQGMAMGVLNVNRQYAVPRRRKRQSRGLLIPHLLECSTLEEVRERAREISPNDYPPFRLVGIADGEVVEFYSDGQSMRQVEIGLLTDPRFFTSSGLGDHLVEGPRWSLFQSFFDAKGDCRVQQEAFHRHSWPGRTQLSVCMSRADARTVSFTTIDLGEMFSTLEYRPGSPDEPCEAVRCTLPLKREVFT